MHGPSMTSSPMHVDQLSLGYILGQLQQADQDQIRRQAEQASEAKALKARVEKLEHWGERAIILLVLYSAAIGLHLTAGSMGPLLGALLRSALGIRS